MRQSKCIDAFTLPQLLDLLIGYEGIDSDDLRKHLIDFLKEVTPVAEELGLKLAIHPDDPPFSVLGLPRIVSTADDIRNLIKEVPSTTNGLCFCTGSFGARKDNDLISMMDEFEDRIHFLHFRNTKMDELGNFHEAAHLEGDANMPAIIKKAIDIMQKRKISIPMRPDHGHQMLSDLGKKGCNY